MRPLIAATALTALTVGASLGANPLTVKGTNVEAPTAEVIAGGCVMNGEAGTTGRNALLAWRVDRGQINGVPVNGLAIVAAVSADKNLGIHEIGGEPAITRTALFVDQRATPAQRAALVSMAKQLSNGVVDDVVAVTPAPIQFVDAGQDIRVSANALQLTVQKEMTHDPTCSGKL
jgi:hypothetical protein